jgi:uncharacterized coiled-coil protein SlyX
LSSTRSTKRRTRESQGESPGAGPRAPPSEGGVEGAQPDLGGPSPPPPADRKKTPRPTPDSPERPDPASPPREPVEPGDPAPIPDSDDPEDPEDSADPPNADGASPPPGASAGNVDTDLLDRIARQDRNVADLTAQLKEQGVLLTDAREALNNVIEALRQGSLQAQGAQAGAAPPQTAAPPARPPTGPQTVDAQQRGNALSLMKDATDMLAAIDPGGGGGGAAPDTFERQLAQAALHRITSETTLMDAFASGIKQRVARQAGTMTDRLFD